MREKNVPLDTLEVKGNKIYNFILDVEFFFK
jgi:hypothetical protein